MTFSSVLIPKLLSTHHYYLAGEVPLIRLLRTSTYIFNSCISSIGDIPQASRSLTAHLLEVSLHEL